MATDAGKEIWESTVEGRTSVMVENARGRGQTLSVKGKGQRLRLTADERALIEEPIRDEQHNPFRNGSLIQVGGPKATDIERSNDELSDDDLGMLFDLRGTDYKDAVSVLSEVNVRRLKLLAVERDAAKSQIDFIAKHIEQKWPIGADTPSNAEARGDRTVTV